MSAILVPPIALASRRAFCLSEINLIGLDRFGAVLLRSDLLTVSEGQSPMTDKELMHEFLTLGEDCQFSFVQRKAGAEPLEMMRFGSTTIIDLIAAFEDAFVAVGDPAFTTIRVDENDVWGFNTRYHFGVHGFGSIATAKQPGFDAKFTKKMEFLRRKFMEDLAEGRKFLVYQRRKPLAYFQVHALYTAVRRLGANPLLWVVKADQDHAPGSVAHLGGGFFKGYVDDFAPVGRAAYGSFDVWLDICRKAYALRQTLGDALRLEPPPPWPPGYRARHAWLATASTILKRSPVLSTSLAESQTRRIAHGDIIIANGYECEAKHLKLFGVAVNGEPLREPWFAYTAHLKETPCLGTRSKD